MTPAIGLFLATVLRKEKYRYNFGRAWHSERMKATDIRLPSTMSGRPDWGFMDRYIRSMPFGHQVS